MHVNFRWNIHKKNAVDTFTFTSEIEGECKEERERGREKKKNSSISPVCNIQKMDNMALL
jgi:hypothetical protein